MPGAVRTHCEVNVRVEIECCEAFLAFDVASILHFTVLEVKNGASDVSLLSGDGLVERKRPFEIVLPTCLVKRIAS